MNSPSGNIDNFNTELLNNNGISSNHNWTKKKQRVEQGVFFILIAIGFLIQYFLDKPLINISLTIIENTKNFAEKYRTLWLLLKEIGGITPTIIIIMVIFVLSPITKCYSWLSIIVYAWFISSLLDIIYGPPNRLNITAYFNGENEKPSGHCLIVTCTYISWRNILWSQYSAPNGPTWNMFNKGSKYNSKLYRVAQFSSITFVVIVILIVSICQVILKEHSLSKCFIGSLYGCCIYYLIFIFFSLQNYHPKSFLKIFKNNSTSIWIFFCYIMGIFILMGWFYSYERKFHYMMPWYLIENKQTLFNVNALLNGFVIFILIGLHMGLRYWAMFINEKYPGKEIEINLYNDCSIMKKIMIYSVILFYSVVIVLNLSVNTETSPFIAVLLVKTVFPMIMTGFIFYGVGLCACIEKGFCNENIYVFDNGKDAKELQFLQNEDDDDDDNDEEEEEEEEEISEDRQGDSFRKKEKYGGKKGEFDDLVTIHYE